MSLLVMKVISGEELIFSKTLDRNDSLEIGLWLFRTDGSRLGFFRRGWMMACLKPEGKVPVDRDVFMMARTWGEIE